MVASEGYKDFVTGLQKDLSQSLSDRPRVADEAYFTGKIMDIDGDTVEVTPQMAKQIYKYLLKNVYTDDNDHVAQAYHNAVKEGTVAPLPEALQPYKEQIFQLIESLYCDAKLPQPENGRSVKTNPLNDNFNRKEFKALWHRINRKAAYSVHFDRPGSRWIYFLLLLELKSNFLEIWN
ncbi:hypothetical protein [Desulfocicer niacini]